jgi:hypothetical protein
LYQAVSKIGTTRGGVILLTTFVNDTTAGDGVVHDERFVSREEEKTIETVPEAPLWSLLELGEKEVTPS